MCLTDNQKYEKIIKQLKGKDKRAYKKLVKQQKKAQKLYRKYEKLYIFYNNQIYVELLKKMKEIEFNNNIDFFEIK